MEHHQAIELLTSLKSGEEVVVELPLHGPAPEHEGCDEQEREPQALASSFLMPEEISGTRLFQPCTV